MLSRPAISAKERKLPEANSSNHPLERATALRVRDLPSVADRHRPR